MHSGVAATAIPSGKRLATFPLFSGGFQVTQLPDGRVLSASGDIRVWDASRELNVPVPAHSSKVAAVSAIPGGWISLSPKFDQDDHCICIELAEWGTREIRSTIPVDPAEDNRPLSLCICKLTGGGNAIAIGTDTGKVYVLPMPLKAGTLTPVTSIFSPDEDHVLAMLCVGPGKIMCGSDHMDHVYHGVFIDTPALSLKFSKAWETNGCGIRDFRTIPSVSADDYLAVAGGRFGKKVIRYVGSKKGIPFGGSGNVSCVHLRRKTDNSVLCAATQTNDSSMSYPE